MPISYSIEGRVLLVLCEGAYTRQDIRIVTERAIADPLFEAPMYLLADARRAESRPTALQLNETANLFGLLRRQFVPHWSLVIEGEMSRRLSQLFAVMLKAYGIELNIYATLEEARAGLEAFQQEQARRTRKKK